MNGSITLRPLFSRIVAAIVVVFAIAALVSFVMAYDGATLLRTIAAPALAGYAAWLVLWQPAVHISDSGVRLENVFRTIHLPWPSIQRIDTKWSLTLYTTFGRFAAWAAPAPGRHSQLSVDPADTRNLPDSSYVGGALRPGDVPRTASGDAATIIRMRWEHLRDAGYLEDARPETERPPVRIHWVRAGILVALVALTVLSAILANGVTS
jgi:hypothetical protein